MAAETYMIKAILLGLYKKKLIVDPSQYLATQVINCY